ncbi:hypothetical protein VNO77_03271 [Canavalia gladiata]|uniref:Uncharacterized protein n=1 Tax=Canavalia gladiata TaxID=3824 RepID=A0AAN9N0V7_CANGL
MKGRGDFWAPGKSLALAKRRKTLLAFGLQEKLKESSQIKGKIFERSRGLALVQGGILFTWARGERSFSLGAKNFSRNGPSKHRSAGSSSCKNLHLEAGELGRDRKEEQEELSERQRHEHTQEGIHSQVKPLFHPMPPDRVRLHESISHYWWETLMAQFGWM